MLSAQLVVQLILELGQCCVPMARDSNGGRLVLGGVRLDVMFEGVVVDVICTSSAHGIAPGLIGDGGVAGLSRTKAPLRN
jgi:hypothetical protein